MSAPKRRRAVAYLQVRDGSRKWESDATVLAVTNTEPRVIAPGCIVVKVTLTIPAEAWQPIAPEAVVDVPLEMVRRPVDVVVQNAGGAS